MPHSVASPTPSEESLLGTILRKSLTARERAAPSAFRRESLRDHGDDGVEVFALECAIRPGPSHDLEELILGVIGARTLRDNLLRQHVERRIVDDDAIELAAFHRPEKGG